MLAIATWAGLALPPLPTAPPVEHPALVLGHTETLRSEILGEDRELFVYLPNGYSDARRYPLLVLLDGPSSIKFVAGMLHGLAESGAIPRTIVCGVGNTDRWRDLTPYALPEFPGSGGGRAFVAFLAEELVPYLDAKWSTTGFRTLFGHSLGGLTALQALIETPDVFDAYIALSPSLEWADGRLLEDLGPFLRERETLARHLFLALADERVERPYYDELVQLLERAAPAELQWESRLFEDEDDHGSIRVSGGLAGLRSIYRDWRLSSARIVALSANERAAFLARATKKYETPRTLGILDVTNAGYYAVDDPATAERGLALFQEAIERWPDDPYPYSCLGEGLERVGRLDEALAWMERALEHIENDRFGDRAYYDSMITRVRRKLGR